MKRRKVEIDRKKSVVKEILDYYEGHKEIVGIYPELTAEELKAELNFDYKDIKFLLNG